MNCICEKFKTNDKISVKERCWDYVRNVYMGRLFRCSCCGSLWIYTIGGHGEGVYVKVNEVNEPWNEKMSMSSQIEIIGNVWSTDERKRWETELAALDKTNAASIQGKNIPEDIVRVLNKLFAHNSRSIKKWFNSPFVIGNICIEPIKVLDRKNGDDILRCMLLKEMDKRKLNL